MEQPCIKNNKFNTNDTNNTSNIGIDTNKKKTWFWNQNANELESNLKCNKYFDLKKNLESEAKREKSKTEKKASPQN